MTATIAAPPTPQAPTPPSYDGVVLDGISWETYERLREELDDAGLHIQIVYDDGRMAIMSPSGEHDREKKLLGRMVEMLSFELDIPIASFGSTTWKRKDLRKGLEPDECYYVQREPKIGGRKRVDLKRDPPPDLVIEVEVTRRPIAKFPVYAALGVPEIWHYDGKHLKTLRLKPGGKYEPAEHSLAFPFLRPSDLEQFICMLPAVRERDVMKAFQAWVRTLPK